MPTKSLKSQIETLANSLGESDKPTLADIRSQLFKFASLAEALENNEPVREAEAKITALEAAPEQKNAEVGDLKIKLQTANAEIKTFRADEKKQKEKDREIPPIQFKILARLPKEDGGGSWLRIDEIARSLNIPPDEAEVHLNKLERAGLGTQRHNVWHRSMSGNELVLAKRLAGEEQTPARKYPELPDIEERMLAVMIGESEGVGEEYIHKYVLIDGVEITLEKVKWLLKASLKTKGFADYDPEEGTYGAGYTWFITDRGTEYFFERDKL